MSADLGALDRHLMRTRLVVFKVDASTWNSLWDRPEPQAFTMIFPHKVLKAVKKDAACLIRNVDAHDVFALALTGKRMSVSTFDSRIKFRRFSVIEGKLETILAGAPARLQASVNQILSPAPGLLVLGEKAGIEVVRALRQVPECQEFFRIAESSLQPIPNKGVNGRLQSDAIRTALRAFGFKVDDSPNLAQLLDSFDSQLTTPRVLEDAAIEHDARYIEGFDLVGSDITGRAVFKRVGEELHVITANKRPLEQVLGVDLIYINMLKDNIVMVQYKILERPDRSAGDDDDELTAEDWYYRPNKQLDKEIGQMAKFTSRAPCCEEEYRLNEEVFYLKFFRRTGSVSQKGVILALDQFRLLRIDKRAKGPNGGIRITANSLEGRYISEAPFLDLIRKGMIGSCREATAHFKDIIDFILTEGHSAVVAIAQATPEPQRSNGNVSIDDPDW